MCLLQLTSSLLSAENAPTSRFDVNVAQRKNWYGFGLIYTLVGCDVIPKQKQHGGFGRGEESDFAICKRLWCYRRASEILLGIGIMEPWGQLSCDGCAFPSWHHSASLARDVWCIGHVVYDDASICAILIFLERLKEGNVHMCFSCHSGNRPFITPPPALRN